MSISAKQWTETMRRNGMPEQWEFCRIDYPLWEDAIDLDNGFAIFSPTGETFVRFVDFIKQHEPGLAEPDRHVILRQDKETRQTLLGKFTNKFWSYFLSEGWEPYAAVYPGHWTGYVFRRKLSS